VARQVRIERLANEPHTRLRYFCSPQHTDSALYPTAFRGLAARDARLPISVSGIRHYRQKCRPSLWPRQSFSRQEFAARTETGSTLARDWFDKAPIRTHI
jgi:hypothetical protein